ncbi:TadE/TadG family type IV pilus assembly protein [Bordetella genomosp. 13]|uniref:TadE/TadG family type IV pilus assembly protein n=1 Tax=Bordetella genomosp. 13 TaxID=463040 RepID=UPI00119FAF55|nr:hypothetical protein [Bordetella genomosp. 13]
MMPGTLPGIMLCAHLSFCGLRRPPRQRGAALVESAAALGAVLLVALAAIEAMHWQLMRQLAYVALTEAARAGATGNARPALIAQSFEAALLPRYASPGGSLEATLMLHAAQARTAQRTGMPAWHIAVLRPGAAAYADFAHPGLRVPAAPGLPAVRNEYQAEQHAAYLSKWPDGKGPRSGLTIFQANTLRLRLRYLVEPITPVGQLATRMLAALPGAGGGCAVRALSAGVLPLDMTLTMDMQSHPVQWPAGVHPQIGEDDDAC